MRINGKAKEIGENAGRSILVLVVDDNEMNCDMLSRRLSAGLRRSPSPTTAISRWN